MLPDAEKANYLKVQMAGIDKGNRNQDQDNQWLGAMNRLLTLEEGSMENRTAIVSQLSGAKESMMKERSKQ